MFSTTGHKIFQGARSLRRACHDEHQHQPPPPSHARQISVSSDASRASSSGSDVSAGREHSLEWDSLRLHPSTELERSPHITATGHEKQRHHHNYGHYAPHGDVESRHPHMDEHRPELRGPRQPQPMVTLQIYDGFDFGFEKSLSLSSSPTDSDSGSSPRRLRAPKSEADLRRPRNAEEQLPVSPSRRPYFDEADYFIKRGGWKRRGIVFGGVQEPRESECFDIF